MTRGRRNSGTSLFAGVDRWAVLLYVLLTIVGFVAILSATWSETSENIFAFSHQYVKQLIWIFVSWIMATVILLLDNSMWHKFSYFLYAAGIAALVFTLLFGRTVNGAKAWFDIGGFRIQPMEFVKIAIALATARIMSSYSFSINKISDISRLAALILLPLAIVVLQNDTGSGIVLSSFLFVFYREGLNKWICIPLLIIVVLFILSFLIAPTLLLVVLILIFVLSEYMINRRLRDCLRFLAGVLIVSLLLELILMVVVPGGFDYYWSLLIATLGSLPFVLVYAFRNNLRNIYISVAIFFMSVMLLPTSNIIYSQVLKPHHQKRIMSYLGIISDPTQDYNVNQSKIAIGSGGFLGKGYLQGSQIRYGFVPEKHTDFIFCTIAEETGFVGCIVVLTLLGALIFRLMKMGDRREEAFGRVYCYCVAAILLFHTMVNVGMTMGMIPVVGIPLPFISYGGSSLLAMTILVFIAISLDAKKPTNGLIY